MSLPGSSPALTLVEVLAALVLLAGTVTTLLLAQSRALEQQSATAERNEASRLAEELIQHWRLVDEDLSVDGQGALDAQPGWVWRRWVEEYATDGDAMLVRVHLEVLRVLDRSDPRTVAEYEWLEPREVRR